jgi:RHS repeat-associated protein
VAFVPSAQGTEVVQENSYYPFGAPIADLSWSPKSTNRYLREGKEYISDFDWNKYDFTGRTFDSWTAQALQVDPMATKYYNTSPYALWTGNPMKFIDTEGKEIRLYNIIKIDNRGQAVAIQGLSSTTESAMKDVMKTREGVAFFAQFAKAGDVLGDYTFTKDGTLSNVTLNMWDYSYEKGEIPSYAQPKSGSIGVADDKKTVTLKVVSNGVDKTDIAETLTHETQIHGFNISNKIAGTPTTTEAQDHNALKNQDTSHKGYKQYKSVQEQLQKIDEEYIKIFQEALRDAQQY